MRKACSAAFWLSIVSLWQSGIPIFGELLPPLIHKIVVDEKNTTWSKHAQQTVEMCSAYNRKDRWRLRTRKTTKEFPEDYAKQSWLSP